MTTITLGQFLLSRYSGALLPEKGLTPVIPGTVEAMIPEINLIMSDHVEFVFKGSPPLLTEIHQVLIEYYRSINWHTYIQEPQEGVILGDVYPEEGDCGLSLLAGFLEKNTKNKLTVTTAPPIC